eukprot:TRINITY_DN1248_c0_g1_i1.p3 TRINITY_DN1248_c0_g1~~TRINITY_DN1248_c0_g1_i1.p3  ORF type:complete len:146 (-),score=4.08 TRINITY_DN1248_c0_g1_i1:1306-1743(-)
MMRTQFLKKWLQYLKNGWYSGVGGGGSGGVRLVSFSNLAMIFILKLVVKLVAWLGTFSVTLFDLFLIFYTNCVYSSYFSWVYIILELAQFLVVSRNSNSSISQFEFEHLLLRTLSYENHYQICFWLSYGYSIVLKMQFKVQQYDK